MKAAPAQQLRLLELAGFDAARARLQHTAKNLPEQRHLEQIEADRRERRAAVAKALGELEDAQTALRRLEKDVATVVKRQHDDEEQLAHAATAKTAAAFEAEVEALRRRRERLEDEQLEAEQQVQTLQTAYDEADTRMRELEDLAADLLARRELARENLKTEAKELGAKRRALVAELPADLVALYEQIRERAGVGAAELVGTVSLASNETLELADMAKIRKAGADDVVFCPATGAILVRTSRSDV